MTRYDEFLESKRVAAPSSGFEVGNDEVSDALFDFQSDIVSWACRKGKAAIFADCGLGKTLMQLEWARLVVGRTGGRVLVLAPLAVSGQTRDEGSKFGIPVTVCRSGGDVGGPGIYVTNYEMLHKFDPSAFTGVVLDESSILKSFSGKVCRQVIDAFAQTDYKLACTATPSPNDHMELGTHAEFLGVMTRPEMLAMFFVHDGGDTSKWRLKGHARAAFWDFVSTWAVMVSNPSDMGYAAGNFDLPELVEEVHVIESGVSSEGRLFAVEAEGLLEQSRARKATIADRCALAAGMVNASDRPWIVWCDLNDESAELARLIPDAVEVRGSDPNERKEEAMTGFSDGTYRVIVTKPSICGFGMNWQHCADMCFAGLSHSYEQYYQAVRRCYRFGQESEVHVHIVTSDVEAGSVRSVMRKREDALEMRDEMMARAGIVRDDITRTGRESSPYVEDVATGDGWTAMMGDCVTRMAELDDESVGFSIFSPPFASLYTYSNSDRDMGNCRGDGEFLEHFGYLVRELFRVTKPSRLVSFHCMNLPTSKERDGYIGIRDFRGELIRAFQEEGFIYHSEVTIWKDPVTAMQRTKALGLLNRQKNKDSAMSRQGIPDYLVTMRKPGDNPDPISHTNDEFPISQWQKIASPVWMDINPSRTLQHRAARDGEDERHICPLQLDVIERAVDLWSKPGDLVLSPFMGIGSEGYVSVRKGRRFVGIELKPSYWEVAVRNLEAAEQEASALTIDDFLEVVA